MKTNQFDSSIQWLNDKERTSSAPLREPEIYCKVPMRDGTCLVTTVHLPQAQGNFPTILVRTCYRHSTVPWNRFNIERYLSHGYAVVLQMVRGLAGSEGTWT